MANPFVVGSVLEFGGKLIDKLFPSKEEADKAKLQLLELEQKGELTELVGRQEIVKTEAGSVHWLTATWRPITMLCFVAVVVNNYILVPYLMAFGVSLPVITMPTNLWDVIELGLGGYVIGRSGEKIADKIADAVKGKRDAG